MAWNPARLRREVAIELGCNPAPSRARVRVFERAADGSVLRYEHNGIPVTRVATKAERHLGHIDGGFGSVGTIR
jgi:hypothetical protein